MHIAIPKESKQFEERVAASPETVKKLVGLGATVVVQEGAGIASDITDEAFKEAGATLAADFKSTLQDAEVILKVQSPTPEELKDFNKGSMLLAILNPRQTPEELNLFSEAGITTFSLDLIPRITRAQSMDVLSSQSNLAGYRAVIDAAHEFNCAFPMMMTAAGTISPAKVLVMGAGVAGLQAIATAKRLGAVVSAFDVRHAAKEQVESLGAKFIEVENTEDAETKAGYAKEMSAEYKKRQAEKIEETLKKTDIVICTALIPGRPAPKLITKEMLQLMHKGSVVVDLAVENGGNCEGSEFGKVVEKGGVKIIGYGNVPSRVSKNASLLYAKNILNFLMLSIKGENKKSFQIDWDDEIICATALTHNGKIVHEEFTSKSGGEK